MWADEPSILKHYAKHYQNGSPMPQALLDKVIAASKFNQGFATTEYLGAAMLDQNWHQVSANQVPDAAGVMAFEAKALQQDGIAYASVPPRYETPYSATSWAVTRQAITPTSGRKCWTPTPSSGSSSTVAPEPRQWRSFPQDPALARR